MLCFIGYIDYCIPSICIVSTRFTTPTISPLHWQLSTNTLWSTLWLQASLCLLGPSCSRAMFTLSTFGWPWEWPKGWRHIPAMICGLCLFVTSHFGPAAKSTTITTPTTKETTALSFTTGTSYVAQTCPTLPTKKHRRKMKHYDFFFCHLWLFFFLLLLLFKVIMLLQTDNYYYVCDK